MWFERSYSLHRTKLPSSRFCSAVKCSHLEGIVFGGGTSLCSVQRAPIGWNSNDTSYNQRNSNEESGNHFITQPVKHWNRAQRGWRTSLRFSELNKALSKMIKAGSAFSTRLDRKPLEFLFNLNYSMIFPITVMVNYCDSGAGKC